MHFASNHSIDAFVQDQQIGHKIQMNDSLQLDCTVNTNQYDAPPMTVGMHVLITRMIMLGLHFASNHMIDAWL